MNANHLNQSEPTYKKTSTLRLIVRFFSFVLLTLFVFATVVMIADMWYEIKFPANAHKFVLPDNPKKAQAFKYANVAYACLQTDTSLMFISFDSSMNVMRGTLMPIMNLNIQDCHFDHGLFYLVGGKSLGTQGFIPFIAIVYNDHYEPFFESDIDGQYMAMSLDSNKILLAKIDNSNQKTYIEVRDRELNLIKKITLPYSTDVNFDKLFVINHNKLILKFNTPEQTYALAILDTTARLIWEKNFDSDFMPFISNKQLWVLMPHADSLNLYKFDLNGRLLRQNALALGFNPTDLAQAQVYNDTLWALLHTNNHNFIIAADSNGKLLWKLKVPLRSKLDVLQWVRFGPEKIVVIAKAHYKYLDWQAQTPVYLLYLFPITNQGKMQRWTLPTIIRNYFKYSKPAVDTLDLQQIIDQFK